VWLHIVLLAMTFGTTTLAGCEHQLSFLSDFGIHQPRVQGSLVTLGLPYSLTVLAILGAHEMGHYLACRYYRIGATLPFFLPDPLFPVSTVLRWLTVVLRLRVLLPFMVVIPPLAGTFGAVIRIRQPIRRKTALFDIGIAGPIAGFLVAVPALLYGLWHSNVMPVPPHMQGVALGEPLLFKAASWLVWGRPAIPFEVNIHPVAFGAWFGLLATALNLFPIAQLDGGHIAYCVFGRRAIYVTYAAVAAAFCLTLLSTSWFLFTLMMVVMLRVVGAQHPPVLDEDVPLDPARRWLALFALIMFILCFTPAPIEPLELLKH
jgi:membrane-associated protease RseP (regulator of RpoE activity)